MSQSDCGVAAAPEKRTAILDQAIRTFAELGFRGADVQVIADRAGVGKGTVYRYFGNKEDLFWATSLEVFLRLKACMFAALGQVDGAVEQLRAAGRAYAGFFDANPAYLEVFVEDRAEFRGTHPPAHQQCHEEAIARFVRIVQQGIDQGELYSTDPRKTVLGLAGLLYGSVVHSCYAVFAANDCTLTEITQHALDIFLKGLCTKTPADEQPTDERGKA